MLERNVEIINDMASDVQNTRKVLGVKTAAALASFYLQTIEKVQKQRQGLPEIREVVKIPPEAPQGE